MHRVPGLLEYLPHIPLHLAQLLLKKICNVAFTLLPVVGGKELNIRCILDDDGTTPEVDRCLRQGDSFLARYLRHIRDGNIQEFDRCRYVPRSRL